MTEGLAYVVAHCTAGDVIILAAAPLLALVLVGDGAWPERGCRSVTVATTGRHGRATVARGVRTA